MRGTKELIESLADVSGSKLKEFVGCLGQGSDRRPKERYHQSELLEARDRREAGRCGYLGVIDEPRWTRCASDRAYGLE